MSAAEAVAAAPKNGGKKKLLIILAAALLLVGGGGTGALVFIKKRQAAAEAAAEEGDDTGDAHPAKAAAHDEHRTPPTFVPLDPFVINLADHDADRYAQIGVTLQVPDTKAGDDINNYKPAIRNNILLLLAHKTSDELAGREGKQKLAAEIRREALRAMGYELPDEDAATKAGEASSGGAEAHPRKKKKAKVPDDLPITAVVFSSFIIQ